MLGNAYLTLFVHSSGVMKQELIKKSYSSYERAEKLGQNFNPDLHYNRAQVKFPPRIHSDDCFSRSKFPDKKTISVL